MKNSLLLLIIFFITSGTSAQYISKSQSGPMKYTGQRINQPNSRSVTSGDVNLTSLNSLKSIKSSNFRTENSLVQKLDSIIIQGINSNSTLSNSEKNSYDYDSAGNILSVTNYIWSDSLLSWHLLFRTEHSYANSGRMLTTTLYNDQGLADKTEYTYDSDGNRIKELQQTWNNSLNQLVNSSKSDYSFDLAGNLKTGTTLHWDDTLQAWYNWSLLEYSYDTAGRLNFKTYWSWINNEWFYPVKTVYAYNSTGLITSIEQYRAGSLPQQWIGLYRSSYEYDSATQLFSTTYQYWQEETNQWINMSKTEYAYSSQGSLLRDVEFNWYPSVSEWNPMIKFEYGYNEVGDRISEEYYYWNTVNSL